VRFRFRSVLFCSRQAGYQFLAGPQFCAEQQWTVDGRGEKDNEEASHRCVPRARQRGTATGTAAGTWEEQSIGFLVFN
jgi:hypothetical protein